MDSMSFKKFVGSLIADIVAKGDARARADAATIANLSAQCSELSATVNSLKAALDVADSANVARLAEVAAAQAADLDALSSELQSTYNPTPVADAVVEVVKESEDVPTPPIVETATEVNTAEVTPDAVVEAAVEAIAEVAVVEAVEVVAA